MKNITDYFSSPTKLRKSSELAANIKFAKKSSDQNVNPKNKIVDNSDGSEVSKDEAKPSKKKRRRKPTDPEIRNVTELLSNNLNLISPNTSGVKTETCPSPLKKTPKKVKGGSSENGLQNADQEKNNSNSSKSTSAGKRTSINDHGISKPDKISESKTLHSSNDNKNIQDDEIKWTTSDTVEIKEAESNSHTPNDAPKVNAFQFLMNSRNSIIGQNFNGKTANEEDISDHQADHRSKLATRKDLFKNWADQKGALKRKREEEEIERCINYKMKKRAKRLKNLLQRETEENNSKKVKDSKSPMKIKKTIKIQSSSESESSTDPIQSEPNEVSKISNSSLVNIDEVIEENAQDIILISSPLLKKQRESSQNNLLNFFGVLSKETKEERIEVFEDSSKKPSKELIKIKMFTPESTKKRTSLLSLNRERTKSMTDESSQESLKIKKHKKKKKKRKNAEEKSQSDGHLNDSLEDFCSPESRKVNTSVKKSRKRDGVKENKDKSSQVNENKNLQSKIMANEFENEFCCLEVKKNSLNIKNSKQENNKKFKDNDTEDVEEQKINNADSKKMNVIRVDESSQDSDIIWSKNKKGTKHCIIADSDDSEDSTCKFNENSYGLKLSVDAVDESTQDSDLIKSETGGHIRHHIIDDDSREHQQNKDVSQDTIDRRKKRQDTKIKDNMVDIKENGTSKKEEKIKPEDMETEGRVLRPKRNNLNYSDFFRDQTPKIPKANEEKCSVKKNRKSSNKNDSIEKVELSSDSDYEDTAKKKAKVSFKVAPVFLKATPKPKLDPEMIEARKKFLLSGVPDSLKMSIEKQRSIEEKEYTFPNISHIQQKCQSKFWNLPKPDLQYDEKSPFNLNAQSLAFSDLIVKQIPYEINITLETEKVIPVKYFLNKIKTENPNYPVYKVFRHIYEKSGKHFLNEQPKNLKSPRRRSKKATRKVSEPSESVTPETSSKDCEMWSEKYKPRSSEEILGNHNGVNALKGWLETWINYSEEINARGKRKRSNSNSESEFESTDCDSRDSTGLPGNTVILGGPCGSGKTSTVYAIANELGFNVLELNASSKRTGKRLIQELQEATQSHQVRKNESSALTHYINPDRSANKGLKSKESNLKDKKPDLDEKSDQKDKKKMCILLVEDVDLVFDQDEGFLTSLSQLITTSKRPIILTTTDNSPAHVQKLLLQYEYIVFMPLSLQCLGVWLQILCLVEGLLVDKDDLGNLLEYNKGDIRKTLLEVQFWSQSGGQLERTRLFPFKTQGSRDFINCDLKASDEELKIVLKEDVPKENYFIHKHCLGSFEVFRENKEYNVPQYLHLGALWWNIPNILEVSSYSIERLNRQERQSEGKQEATNDTGKQDKLKLDSILRFYDALTLTDSLFKTVHFHSSNEPVVKNWLTDIRDSLELNERNEDTGIYLNTIHELTHTLVNGCIENYKSIDATNCRLDMALPDPHERRWRAKQHICEDFLKEPIPLLNSLDRSSIALDYLPSLRDIARFEEKRAALNTKRGNRFRHYLKNLNMNFKESTCKLACNMLSVTDNDNN